MGKASRIAPPVVDALAGGFGHFAMNWRSAFFTRVSKDEVGFVLMVRGASVAKSAQAA
jgi:hypothetical protein